MHLESTLDYIRRHGQLIGQLIIQRIHLFSQSNQLQFDTYDKNHSEVQMLTKLAKIKPVVFICEKRVCSTNGIVLHDSSINDDVDSEFESYDYSHDTVKCDVEKRKYIRACLADLLSTDKIGQLESALHMLPSLIEMYKIECEEVALELVRILLLYNSTFTIENFPELQLNDLITLCENYPLLISDYLCQKFYKKNYTTNQRSLLSKDN
ncbi:unnamed protein product [Rotaria sp. Silwood2]|nr:unnamed protein product [Rotaria sp. Silwood2]CAF4708267.1 unnamed protein product [Rotaria sp. Silwood2]